MIYPMIARGALVPLLVPLLLAASVPAAATQTTKNQDQPIVVTGNAPKAQIQHLVHAIGGVHDYGTSLARFDYVCPRVVGLDPEFDAVIEDRVRANARWAGIETDSKGCDPNLVVLFVDSGQQVVAELAKKSPYLFGEADRFGNLERDVIAPLKRDPGPVHAWSATGLRTRDGGGQETRAGAAGGSFFVELPVDLPGWIPSYKVHSATAPGLPLATRVDVEGSIILIDRNAAVGKTLAQLADYITMRAIAQGSPVKSDATILSLFDQDSSTASAELTAFDRDYLKALYRLPSGERATVALSKIADRIVQLQSR